MRIPSVGFRQFRSGLLWLLTLLPALLGTLLLLNAASAAAAVPQVVVDSQMTLLDVFSFPESIAVFPLGSQFPMVYVADAGNNRVAEASSSSYGTVSTAPYTLVNPKALALDSAGDLFIGDSPSAGTGRVLEAMATDGVLNGTVNLIVSGSPIEDVTALTVDTNPASSTFNTLYIGDDVSNAIYTVAPGATAAVNLDVTGLPSGVVPAALAKDTAGDLFIADFLTTLYEVPSGSTAAETYVASGFVLNSPTGLAFDPKGNLYILTLTSFSGPPAEAIVEIPGGDATSAFEVPLTGVGNASGVGIDGLGNLYVLDYTDGDIAGLIYSAPTALASSAAVGVSASPISFNYEFNTALTVSGFQSVSQGDLSTEIQYEGGNCAAGTYSDSNSGGAISPSNPFTCQEMFAAQPSYPGFRGGAIELKGTGSTILASTPVFSTGVAGASVIYPLAATLGATDLVSPEALAYSGFNKKLYIADNGSAAVYSTIGPDGKALTKVNTGSIVLEEPSGLVINGEGDLYIADAGLGEIVVVPANSSVAPYAFNPGNLLIHPIALTFDFYGNLIIGDEGPGGVDADASNPGYLVEVPVAGGAPFKINTGGVTIIFPQALTTNLATAEIYVGDGGDQYGDGSELDYIPPGGGANSAVLTDPGEYSPVGIAFDAGGNGYLLDSISQSILFIPQGGTPLTLPIAGTLLTNPSALAMTAAGQSMAVANLDSSGSGPNVVYLNGESSPLNFGTITAGSQSAAQQATVTNIGNQNLTLNTPYFTSNNNSPQFGISNSTTCADGTVLALAATCTMDLLFEPITAGSFTEQLTLQTNGYNSGTSKLSLQGTGN